MSSPSLPPHRRSRRPAQRLQQRGSIIFNTLRRWGRGIQTGWQGLNLKFPSMGRSDRLLAIFLILLWIGIILGYFVLQGRYVFEGNLIVQEMSFTYTGDQDRRFLRTLRGIKGLDVEGSQPEPFVLTGKFSSPTDPVLNQKLNQLDRLTIELPYSSSRLIFAPTTPDSSNLDLLELRLNPQTEVNQLTYQSKPDQLSFCLQSASVSPTLCLYGSNVPDADTSSPMPISSMELRLGQQPLTVNLALFNIPELGIQTDINAPQDLSFQVIPDVDEKLLALLSPSRVYIDLPTITPSTNSKTANFRQWFWNDFNVAQVRFFRIENPDSAKDVARTSTILAGDVRMQGQRMELQENQFLIVDSQPGIRKLRYIQLHPEQPQGLQTLISGESSSIAVGLYPEYPVQTIEPSLLSKYLSQEAINALLAFIAALTGVLLPRLFPESTQKP